MNECVDWSRQPHPAPCPPLFFAHWWAPSIWVVPTDWCILDLFSIHNVPRWPFTFILFMFYFFYFTIHAYFSFHTFLHFYQLHLDLHNQFSKLFHKEIKELSVYFSNFQTQFRRSTDRSIRNSDKSYPKSSSFQDWFFNLNKLSHSCHAPIDEPNWGQLSSKMSILPCFALFSSTIVPLTTNGYTPEIFEQIPFFHTTLTHHPILTLHLLDFRFSIQIQNQKKVLFMPRRGIRTSSSSSWP